MPKSTQLSAGTPCPLNPEHGALLLVRGTSRFYCPHQSHDGRPSTAAEGAAEQTPSFFVDTTPQTKEDPAWLD